MDDKAMDPREWLRLLYGDSITSFSLSPSADRGVQPRGACSASKGTMGFSGTTIASLKVERVPLSLWKCGNAGIDDEVL
jgi:hypothetical protein